jgi:hypothetical protein
MVIERRPERGREEVKEDSGEERRGAEERAQVASTVVAAVLDVPGRLVHLGDPRPF